MNAWKHFGVGALVATPFAALAQIPDLVDALDAGSRAMGMAGASSVTDGNTHSALNNPAGLAFIIEPTVEVSARNLPESDSTITGDVSAPSVNTNDSSTGKTAITHAGYAFPFKGGTLGIAYTLAGYIKDSRSQGPLTDAAFNVSGYDGELRSQTDMFTVGYGRESGRDNWGLSLIYANADARLSESFQQNGGAFVDRTIGGSGNGFGAALGWQRPSADGRSVIGASVRTPIELDGAAGNVYERIPGKASIGYTARMDRDSTADFLVYAAQLDYYFGGEGSAIFDRDDRFSFGIGAEYSYHRWNARFPIRLGYRYLPAGGSGFGDRDVLTYGLGWRPMGRDFSIDLNFASDLDGGVTDTAIGITYRPGN